MLCSPSPRDAESLPGGLRSIPASETAHRARLRIYFIGGEDLGFRGDLRETGS